jgi:hypothetical protein
MIDAARTIKRHWDGILRWHDTHIANGLLEGINSLVQAAKAKAGGPVAAEPKVRLSAAGGGLGFRGHRSLH